MAVKFSHDPGMDPYRIFRFHNGSNMEISALADLYLALYRMPSLREPQTEGAGRKYPSPD